ncbi:hypothetical protein B0T16DRAFT_80399 [Cercophora newfieldiana]|uniref:BZIP domain-containing protein n=1 Tax=Cercophora newfieldiana TaxID=92897 RepID=A0AA39YF37_9PEZI|nr:hypothetical protein B0T16DRAFT_80399 [Cercophora newfieldiana]
MSYGRGVNVSQYLRNLNVPEPAVEETYLTDEDLAKDLALFTNTQFLDFETGQSTDYQAPAVKPEVARRPSSVEDVVTPTDPLLEDFSANLDFMSSDFSFGDFGSTYTSPTIPSFTDSLGNLQPIQPNPQTAYPPPVSQHQPGRMLSFEEASRLAAEEDKRKRNTAASARFRIKKKQREQALEKSAKEMTDKVTALEGRISALETENKWLKSLVTEKHGGKDDILKKLLKEFSSQGVKPSDDKDSDSASTGSSTAADESDSKKSTKRKD